MPHRDTIGVTGDRNYSSKPNAMKEEIVKQPVDKVKDAILNANGCIFSQNQFLGSKGAEALSDEECSGTVSQVYLAMDEYAKKQSVDFFKWYGIKMVGFIEYITTVRPLVQSEEIEEKIKEFEGKDFETLYGLFLQHQQNLKNNKTT